MNSVAKIDNLLKWEFVSFIQYKIIMNQDIKIKKPLTICANTSNPKSNLKNLMDYLK